MLFGFSIYHTIKMVENFIYLVISVFFCILNMDILRNKSGEQQSISEHLQLSNGEIFFWSISLWFLDSILSAFVLGLLGQYSLYSISGSLAIQCVLEVLILRKKVRGFISFESFHLKGKKKIIIWILIIGAFAYTFFPTTYLWARRDPALYVINGINIAQSGGMTYESSNFLNENYEDVKDIVEIGYRGFDSDYESMLSDDPGDITSQFLQLFPAALAIGYSMFGFDGLFRVNGVIGLFCILAVYFLCKRLFSEKCAWIAAILVAFNPAQIWCARIPQTELLFQFLFVLGSYVFAFSWEMKEKKLAILAGILWGLTGFIRIDSYILGIGILAVCCYWNLFTPEKAIYPLSMGISYLLLSIISYYYLYQTSYFYWRNHWNAGVLSAVIYVNIIFLIVTIITLLIGRRHGKKLEAHNFIKSICDDFSKLCLALVLFFVVILLVYFLRPLLQTGSNADWDFNQRALVEFCWYTSLLAIPFFIIGLGFLAKSIKLRQSLLPFIAIGMASLLIYIYKPGIAPDHIWASRRWVSVCFPFLFIVVAYGIEQITTLFKIEYKYKDLLSKGILGLFVLFFLFQSRTFLLVPMLDGMEDQYEELNANLQTDKVYFAEKSHFASILRFVYGKDVYALKEDGGLAFRELQEYIRDSGETVYYIGSESSIPSGLRAVKLYDGYVGGVYLDQQQASYPIQKTYAGGETSVFALFSVDDMDYDEWLAVQKNYKQTIIKDETIISSVGESVRNEDANFLYKQTFFDGIYRIVFKCELLESAGDLVGNIQIKDADSSKTINNIELTTDSFAKNEAEIAFELELSRPETEICIEIYLENNITIRVSEFSSQLISLDYREGIDCQSEITFLHELVAGVNSREIIYVGGKEETSSSLLYLKDIFTEPIKYFSYKEWDPSKITQNFVILKRNLNVENYQFLLDNYIILQATDHYLLLISSREIEIINDWQSNGKKLYSLDKGFSASCYIESKEMYGFQTLKLPLSGCYKITAIIDAMYDLDPQLISSSVSTGTFIQNYADCQIEMCNDKKIKLSYIVSVPENKEESLIVFSYLDGYPITVENVYVEKLLIGDCLNDLYIELLNRFADEQGLRSWIEAYMNKQYTWQEIVKNFIFGAEMEEERLNDREFISAVGDALVGGFSRSEQFKWEEYLADGNSRENFVEIIIESVQFKNKYEELLDSL